MSVIFLNTDIRLTCLFQARNFFYLASQKISLSKNVNYIEFKPRNLAEIEKTHSFGFAHSLLRKKAALFFLICVRFTKEIFLFYTLK